MLNRSGLTLLEVVIAAIIFSVVALMGGSFYIYIQRSQLQTIGRAAANDMNRLVLNKLRKDLMERGNPSTNVDAWQVRPLDVDSFFAPAVPADCPTRATAQCHGLVLFKQYGDLSAPEEIHYHPTCQPMGKFIELQDSDYGKLPALGSFDPAHPLANGGITCHTTSSSPLVDNTAKPRPVLLIESWRHRGTAGNAGTNTPPAPPATNTDPAITPPDEVHSFPAGPTMGTALCLKLLYDCNYPSPRPPHTGGPYHYLELVAEAATVYEGGGKLHVARNELIVPLTATSRVNPVTPH
jgi:prepilin-type N-terminal cleavage/methylation domain-containing protein